MEIGYVSPAVTATRIRMGNNRLMAARRRAIFGAMITFGGVMPADASPVDMIRASPLAVILLPAAVAVLFAMWFVVRERTRSHAVSARLHAEIVQLGQENLELRRSREALLANLPGVVYRCRYMQSRDMEFVSDGCFELIGIDAKELVDSIALSYGDLIFPGDRSRVWREISEATKARQPFQVTYRLQRGTGELVWVYEQGRAVQDDDGVVVALEGFISDISHEKALELQLEHLQRLGAVGRLAGGVAHDFNNLLSVISGFGELIRSNLSASDENRQAIEEILAASETASKLTRQLLAISRRPHTSPEVLSLNSIILQASNMLQRVLGEDLEFSLRLSEPLDFVEVDPSHIEQILINLAVNARDAMLEGGTLTIETKNVKFDGESPVEPNEHRAAPCVLLAVTDTGKGMDEDTMERIFEPFFTTKDPDRGTGLGLATVHDIVNDAGGQVLVESTPGWGTTFRIYLPRVEAQAGESGK